MSIFAKRLREARKAIGLSQERLGILSGIDPMSASARMNQYEKAKHEPNVQITRQIAVVLNIPEAYFYTSDDALAKLLVAFHRLSSDQKLQVLELVDSFSGNIDARLSVPK